MAGPCPWSVIANGDARCWRGRGSRTRSGSRGFEVAFDVNGDVPEFYVLEGDLDTLLAVEPVTYRARRRIPMSGPEEAVVEGWCSVEELVRWDSRMLRW